MRWYCQTTWFFTIKRSKIKVTKAIKRLRSKKKTPNDIIKKNIFILSKGLHQKKFMSHLAIKQVIMLVFINMLWLISRNWCLQKKVVPGRSWRYENGPWFKASWSYSPSNKTRGVSSVGSRPTTIKLNQKEKSMYLKSTAQRCKKGQPCDSWLFNIFWCSGKINANCAIFLAKSPYLDILINCNGVLKQPLAVAGSAKKCLGEVYFKCY